MIMQEVTKEMLKDWIGKGHRKAYQALIQHYALLFENIGFKASLEEIEKELAIPLNFNSAYYAYRKKFQGQDHPQVNKQISSVVEASKFKDLTEINNKERFNF